jgi:UDP-N-acetylmuramate--alanine ligase
VEADEFDRSFLQLFPSVAVINNIEREHLDIYKDFDDLKDTFTEFANKVPFYGFVAVGLDDPGVGDILERINKKIVSFGLSPHSDYYAGNISHSGNSSTFTVYEKGEDIGMITINIPGNHNIKNALASIAVGRTMGIDFGIIKSALAEFGGVLRRFDIKGEKEGVLVVDDYAHHPTEIAETLSAARKGWNRRVIAVFQPHTFTRTRDFYKEFGRAFFDADILVITDVYPAREKPIEGIDGQLIADSAKKVGHKNVIYIQDKNELLPAIREIIRPGDIVITIGAGDIYKVADSLIQ